MADYCEQCAYEHLDIVSLPGHGDLAGLVAAGALVHVLCEGCGPTVVDHLGVCQGGCIHPHHSGADGPPLVARATAMLGPA